MAALTPSGASAEVPSDPLFRHQWYLQDKGVRATAAWDNSRGQGVRVAFVNQGVLRGHPDMAPRVLPGITFLGCAKEPQATDVDGFRAAGSGFPDYSAAAACKSADGSLHDGDQFSGPPHRTLGDDETVDGPKTNCGPDPKRPIDSGPTRPIYGPCWDFHTTGEAGVLAAAKDGQGMVGVAPEALVLPVKVMDLLSTVHGTLTTPSETNRWLVDVARGLRWATDVGGADVISLSWVYPGGALLEDNPVGVGYIRDAIQRAVDAGVIVVASAGNVNNVPLLCDYPAQHAGVICVTGSDWHGERSTISGGAVKLDPEGLTVAAPAGSVHGQGHWFSTTDGIQNSTDCEFFWRPRIISTGGTARNAPNNLKCSGTSHMKVANRYTDKAYYYWAGTAGTSFATPQVAGVAALLIAQGCDAPEIQVVLRRTSRQTILGQETRGFWTPTLGYGIVDATAATEEARTLCGRTDTVVSCEPSSATLGRTARCTATVTDGSGVRHPEPPRGSVRWSSDGEGAFDPPTCEPTGRDSRATCSVTYRPARVGTHGITAAFEGAENGRRHKASSGSTRLPVTYAFRGFLDPVDNPPIYNTATAGAAVPLKFSLDGDHGLDVLAAGSPSSRTIGCVSADLGGDLAPATSFSRDGLTYDPITDEYTYVWKTQTSWANSCRAFTLKLNDDTTREAFFSFR